MSATIDKTVLNGSKKMLSLRYMLDDICWDKGMEFRLDRVGLRPEMGYEQTPMKAKIESRVLCRRIGSFTFKSSDVITFTFPRPVVVVDHDVDDDDDG